MAGALARETGLTFRPAANPFEAMANRDAAVEASGALEDRRPSACRTSPTTSAGSPPGPRCGIGEIRIPELQPGSSIMPGKVNPVIPEAVMMVAAQVVGNDATIAWANALGSNFDLNVMMPVIAYNLLQSIDLLADAAEHLADKCVEVGRRGARSRATFAGVEADAERCQELIERSLAMCTALAPRIGYDAAAAIAKKAYASGQVVREVALELAGKGPRRGRGVPRARRSGAPCSARRACRRPRRSRACWSPTGRRCGGPASAARAAAEVRRELDLSDPDS